MYHTQIELRNKENGQYQLEISIAKTEQETDYFTALRDRVLEIIGQKSQSSDNLSENKTNPIMDVKTASAIFSLLPTGKITVTLRFTSHSKPKIIETAFDFKNPLKLAEEVARQLTGASSA